MRIPIRRKLVYSAVVLAAFFGCAELGLRLLGYEPLRSTPEIAVDGEPHVDVLTDLGVSDQRLGWRLRPNARYVARHIEGAPVVTTDEWGYRNSWSPASGSTTPIVLFVGDSFTLCAEVEDDETVASWTARLLHDRGVDVTPLNAGVSGYSTLQAKRMMEDCFSRFGDRMVAVVYSYCLNDIEGNLVADIRYPFRNPIVRFNEKDGQFREYEPPLLALPSGMERRDWRPRPSQLAPGWSVFLTNHCALFRHCRRGWWRFLASRIDADTTGRRCVIEPDEEMFWHVWAEAHGARPALRWLLDEMQAFCDHRGAKLLVADAWWNTEDPCADLGLAEDCEAAGIAYCPTEPPGDIKPLMAQLVNGEYDGHWNSRGCRAYAECLASALIESLGFGPGLSNAAVEKWWGW